MLRSRLRDSIAPLLLTAASIGSFTSTPADAQTRSLSWTESSTVEMPGALGMILRAAGAAAPADSRYQVHLQGSTLIQGDDNSTVVMDLAAGRWLMIDHQNRSYLTLTLEEMGQLSREAVQGATAAAAPTGPNAAESREALEEARENLRFEVSAEATGQRQRIGAYNATRHFVTAKLESTEVPEGVEQPEGGSMVFLAELWQTTEVPSAESLYQEWARQLAQDARFRETAEELVASTAGSGDALAAAMAGWDPQVGAGMKQMADAMSELEGTTVRSNTTVALVPVGVALNREQLLAWQPASMGSQLQAGAAGAAAQAAAGALRGLGRGLLGGGGGATPPPQQAAATPTVQPLLRITSTRADITYRESNDDVLGALNTRIAGYRQQTLADMRRGAP